MAQDTSQALRSPCLDLVVVIIYRLSGLSADYQYLINLVRECQRAEVCRGQSRKQAHYYGDHHHPQLHHHDHHGHHDHHDHPQHHQYLINLVRV